MDHWIHRIPLPSALIPRVGTSRRRSTPASSRRRPVVTANTKTLGTRVQEMTRGFSLQYAQLSTMQSLFLYSGLTPHPPPQHIAARCAVISGTPSATCKTYLLRWVDLTMRSRREAGQSPAHPRFYAKQIWFVTKTNYLHAPK